MVYGVVFHVLFHSFSELPSNINIDDFERDAFGGNSTENVRMGRKTCKVNCKSCKCKGKRTRSGMN